MRGRLSALNVIPMHGNLEPVQLDEQRAAAIADAFPGLAGAQVSNLGEGQFAEAFVIDDVVFRFPRSEFARGKLKREAKLLSAIDGELPLPTSTPVYDALDGPLIAAFLAHRLLHGEVFRSGSLRVWIAARGIESQLA